MFDSDDFVEMDTVIFDAVDTNLDDVPDTIEFYENSDGLQALGVDVDDDNFLDAVAYDFEGDGVIDAVEGDPADLGLDPAAFTAPVAEVVTTTETVAGQ
ncbi:hypothetical protein F4553_001350 [Allocatelliglobosispora scoriae]|uniref:Uncharacterized protein n=1 Tax=Allocatelliglobosispora scoriae TaxID=643052 RepID=A0A841BM83_9ACTN|nr:hypothetical protein [Allocatelliglobosispora scoriae]MBB5867971.1 hypothetical protein [Allocatelliglobosispora scoriae]